MIKVETFPQEIRRKTFHKKIMENSTITFAVLAGDNYSNWKFRINIILKKEGVQGAITRSEEDVSKLDETGKREFETMNSKAACMIAQAVSDKYIQYIQNASSACEI